MSDVLTQEEVDELLKHIYQNENESPEEEFRDTRRVRPYELKYESLYFGEDEDMRISYDDERKLNIMFDDLIERVPKFFRHKRNAKLKLYLCSTDKYPLEEFIDAIESRSENSISNFLIETNLGRFFIQLENKFCFYILGVSEEKRNLTKNEFEELYENYIKHFTKSVFDSIKKGTKENSTKEIDIEIKNIEYISGVKDLRKLKTNIICSTFTAKFLKENECYLYFCFLQDFEYSFKKNYFFGDINLPNMDLNNSSEEKKAPNIFIQTNFYNISENIKFEKDSIIDIQNLEGKNDLFFNVVFENKIVASGEIVTIGDSNFGIRICEKYNSPIKIENENRFCVRFFSLYISPEELLSELNEWTIIEFDKSLLDATVEIILEKDKISTAEFCPELEKIAVKILE